MSTPSRTFEAIIAHGGLPRRARQDQAVALAHNAVATGTRTIIQAPTGVGKTYVAVATAADAGSPGRPGIIVTTTNSLGDQYLRDLRRASEWAGFSFTRVMGREHYWCADSEAARLLGVPGYDDLVEGEDGGDNREELRSVREAWLTRFVPIGADPASQYELRGDNDDHACPGYPECSGGMLGGCGAKKARARSHIVDVVVSNYHVLAYAHKLGLGLVPLEPAVVVVDEAHKFPDVLGEIDGGTITEGTGSRAFDKYPALASAVAAMIGASLGAVVWPGNGPFDTEAPVLVDPATRLRLAACIGNLPAGAWKKLGGDRRQEDGALRSGDVISLLTALCQAPKPGSTWRAWTTRKWDPRKREWVPDRKIRLRRTDAAAQVTPGMLPDSAIFLSGTIGRTLPAELGMPEVSVVDLGQEFDWSKVSGRISSHSGVKTINRHNPAEVVRARIAARGAELADAARRHRATLVLCNAHTDVRTVSEEIGERLPGYQIFAQGTAGGSLAAAAVCGEYVSHIRDGGHGVLVGVDSFATGLNLPGELCTLLAWWTCHEGVVDYPSRQVELAYPGYLADRFRIRFAQGVGRLLRTHDDVGEVMICDSRGWVHLQGAVGPADGHLNMIKWAGAVA